MTDLGSGCYRQVLHPKTTSILRPLQGGPRMVGLDRFHCITMCEVYFLLEKVVATNCLIHSSPIAFIPTKTLIFQDGTIPIGSVNK